MPQVMLKKDTEQLSLEETLVPGTNVTIRQLLTDENLAAENQQVVYDNSVNTFQHIALLREVAPLTSRAKIAKLNSQTAQAARGEAFVLQLGLCAETMDDKTPAVVKEYAENLGMLINGLAHTLEQEIGMPVVKIVRGAGQFAKPRSVAKENGQWTFRGEVTNGMHDRTPNAQRLVKAYQFSQEVSHSLPDNVHASHEALSLAYEVGLHQGDYIGSAPFLWIGNRTNDVDKLHVNFLKGVKNVIGLKVDGDMKPEILDNLIQTLNPDAVEGKLALIFRIGADEVKNKAAPLLSVAKKHGSAVLSMCDPMHGNGTVDPASKKKTRLMSNIIKETVDFAEACAEMGVPFAGVNVEMSAEEVTECLGEGVTDLNKNYKSPVDPCMNPHQGKVYVQKALIPALKPVMA